MPYIDLGKVRGEDGTIGNISADYINDGGDPGVDIARSGTNSSPDLTFEFRNLVNDPLSASDVESICEGNTVHTSDVVNGTALSNFFAGVKNLFESLFAPKVHKHDASDIDAGQLAAALFANGIISEEMLADAGVSEEKIADLAVTTDKIGDKAVTSAKIADHSVGEEQLDEEVWETLSQVNGLACWSSSQFPMNIPTSGCLIIGRYAQGGDSSFIAVVYTGDFYTGVSIGGKAVTWKKI